MAPGWTCAWARGPRTESGPPPICSSLPPAPRPCRPPSSARRWWSSTSCPGSPTCSRVCWAGSIASVWPTSSPAGRSFPSSSSITPRQPVWPTRRGASSTTRPLAKRCGPRWPACGPCSGRLGRLAARRMWCSSSFAVGSRACDEIVSAVAALFATLLDAPHCGCSLLGAGGCLYGRLCLARASRSRRDLHQQERDVADPPSGGVDGRVGAQRVRELWPDLSDDLRRDPRRGRHPPAALQPPDAAPSRFPSQESIQPDDVPRYQRRELDSERRVRRRQRPLPAKSDVPGPARRGVLSELAVDPAVECRDPVVGLSDSPVR